jgi:polyhydroxyalkanoate synthesis repressor PhaR
LGALRENDAPVYWALAFLVRVRDSAMQKVLGNTMVDASDAGTDASKVVIKKYANRRLYNTASSSYVTLEHLSDMVKAGVDFVVYDAKTGEDITRPVLAQIIFDEESRGSSLLPITFLRQLISFYGDSMQSFLPSYLELSLDSFAKAQERMAKQFGAGALGAGAARGAAMTAGYEEQIRQNMAMFDRAMKMFSPFNIAAQAQAQTQAQSSSKPAAPEAAEPPAAAATPPAGDGDELSELRKQMEAMRREIDRLASKS